MYEDCTPDGPSKGIGEDGGDQRYEPWGLAVLIVGHALYEDTHNEADNDCARCADCCGRRVVGVMR